MGSKTTLILWLFVTGLCTAASLAGEPLERVTERSAETRDPDAREGYLGIIINEFNYLYTESDYDGDGTRDRVCSSGATGHIILNGDCHI